MRGAGDVSGVTHPAATCHIPCRSRCGFRDGRERNARHVFSILHACSRLQIGLPAKRFHPYARRARAHPLHSMAWSTSCQNLHHRAQSDPIEASALLHLE